MALGSTSFVGQGSINNRFNSMSSSVIHKGFLLLLNIFITKNLGDTYLKWRLELKKLALGELVHSDDLG